MPNVVLPQRVRFHLDHAARLEAEVKRARHLGAAQPSPARSPDTSLPVLFGGEEGRGHFTVGRSKRISAFTLRHSLTTVLLLQRVGGVLQLLGILVQQLGLLAKGRTDPIRLS